MRLGTRHEHSCTASHSAGSGGDINTEWHMLRPSSIGSHVRPCSASRCSAGVGRYRNTIESVQWHIQRRSLCGVCSRAHRASSCLCSSSQLHRLLAVGRRWHAQRDERRQLFALHRWHTRTVAHRAHFLRLASMHLHAARFQSHSRCRVAFATWCRRWMEVRSARARDAKADRLHHDAVIGDVWRQWRARMAHRSVGRTGTHRVALRLLRVC